MENHKWIGGVSAALALILTAGSAMAQATGSQSFPIDPYASTTDQTFTDPYQVNPYDGETADGFSSDPFESNADQAQNGDGAQDQNQGLHDIGTTAETSIGEVGQRQTAAAVSGQNPRNRISNRVQNRVQNRFRNRIDRHYDATANATSPFKDASERIEDARGQR
tara:strand:+ start:415 stop:909 length:495 start_codon:yes stop_codon:yes gene_type:complete